MKVAEFEGAMLDAAVAKAEGLRYRINGACFANPGGDADEPQDLMSTFEPSTYWDHGGPIIERERIELRNDIRVDPDTDAVSHFWRASVQSSIRWEGPTPLVAAMRAFVASKLGAEIELPEAAQGFSRHPVDVLAEMAPGADPAVLQELRAFCDEFVPFECLPPLPLLPHSGETFSRDEMTAYAISFARVIQSFSTTTRRR